MPERRDLLQPEGRTGRHRTVAASLQYPQTSLGAGLPAASTRYHQPETHLRRSQRHNAVSWHTLTCAGPKYRSGQFQPQVCATENRQVAVTTGHFQVYLKVNRAPALQVAGLWPERVHRLVQVFVPAKSFRGDRDYHPVS